MHDQASQDGLAPDPDPARRRILLLDDDPAVRTIASRMIQRLGFDVAAVEDGAEAVARFAEARSAGHPFHAVILDHTLPGGFGGPETLRRIRAIDPGVPAILCSGYADALDDPGFDATIPKPFHLDDLRNALASVSMAP